MFKAQTNLNKRGLQASYELSFLLAKESRPYTDGEDASKNQLMWLDPQVCAKYVELAQVAEQTLLLFPTTYLVECAFSAVTDILTKKRGTLDICKRGDLRAKLTCFSPRFSLLTYQHEAHGSY